MSFKHLELLRKSLEDSYWFINQELLGNGYDISEYWEICRPNGDTTFQLAFNGLDDLETLSIQKSFGCYVVDKKEIGCYYSKVGKSFPSELANFIQALSSVRA